MVPIAHEQNIICSKTRLDGTTHEQTIICRQLFAGHVMDSRPIGREEKTHRMIILFVGKQIMQEEFICRSRGELSANEKEKKYIE